MRANGIQTTELPAVLTSIVTIVLRGWIRYYAFTALRNVGYQYHIQQAACSLPRGYL
ncbi:MAG: hypothetical protein J07HQX50_00921 [Haloquadratum sp. J07HQX50]|nr:MAG: hypothetical protein J07HQX50_00921 [Haloquadratum sp. J07HQX50]